MNTFLPGSASLFDLAEKRMLVSLRDGRHLIGTLRSYDQFANLVLEHTIERLFFPNPNYKPSTSIPASPSSGEADTQDTTPEINPNSHEFCFANKPLGLFLIRGENVVLLGEMNSVQEQEFLRNHCKCCQFDELKELSDDGKQEIKKQKEAVRSRVLAERGFCVDTDAVGDAY